MEIGKQYIFQDVESSQRCVCFMQCYPPTSTTQLWLLISEHSLLVFESTEHKFVECPEQDPELSATVIAEFQQRRKERNNKLENLKTQRENMIERAKEAHKKAEQEIEKVDILIEELERLGNY